MKILKTLSLLLAISIYTLSCSQPQDKPVKHATAHVAPATPEDALNMLKEGNRRFLADSLENTDYKEQIAATKDGQHPFGLILCCMDSRVLPEIIFDQGIGNIFVTRVAGNIEDSDVLGGMEYGAVVKGVKVIVVMGHSQCGAVTGAVTGAADPKTPEHLAQLLAKIRQAKTGDTANKEKLIDESTRNNVRMTIAAITSSSPAISDLVKQKKLLITGAIYDIGTGKVEFIQ